MLVPVHDAIGVNVGHLPAGQVAGYITGLGVVPWSAAQQAAHPGMVTIAQSPDLGADEARKADVLDVEFDAATNAIAGAWYKDALASFSSGAHPGQRFPAIYTSASNVTPLVNALIKEGINAGPHLWVANWSLANDQAKAEVQAAGGPFPIIGIQNDQPPSPYYDTSWFSATWLGQVSHAPSKGPYRHVLRAKSVAQMATERHTTPYHLLITTADASTPADHATMVDGLIIYTTNP